MLRVNYAIIIVIFLFFTLINCISSTITVENPATPVKESNVNLDPKVSTIQPLLQFSTVGFKNSKVDGIISSFKSLIHQHYDSKYQVKFLNPSSSIDHINTSQGHGLLLINLRKNDIINQQQLLNYIQAHIDVNLAVTHGTNAHETCHIVLIYDKTDKIPLKKLNDFISNIQSYISYSQNLQLKVSSIEYSTTDEPVETAQYLVSQLDSAIQDVLSVPSSLETNNLKRIENINQLFNQKSVSSFIQESSVEMNAASEIPMLLQYFSTVLTSKLSKYSLLQPTGQSTQLPSNSDLIQLINESNDQLEEISSTINDSLYLTTKSYYLGSIQLRLLIHRILLPYYIKTIELIKYQTIENFTNLIRKIPGRTKEFRKKLKDSMDISLNNFNKQAKEIKKGYLNALKVSGKGLLSIDHSKKQSFSSGNQIPKEMLFQYSIIELEYYYYENILNQLKHDFNNMITQRINYLFYQGSYNPYVREYPFPLTHININYLFDPRNIIINKEFSVLYDDHINGVQENRADPLHLPGVSRLPFDPNEHPVPKYEKPWWKVLKEFYFD